MRLLPSTRAFVSADSLTAVADIGGETWTLKHNCVVAGEVMGITHVLVPSAAKRFALNETASLLWSALEPGATTAELSALLSERFDVQPSDALSQATAFVRNLLDQGLISPAGTA